MMNTLRESLTRFWQALRALWQRVTGGSALRQRAFAVGGALIMLLIIAGVDFASMAPAAAPKQLITVRAQATATETATPPPTVTPTATVKPTPKPTAKPVPTLPPPPPVPTQPPTSSNSNPTTQFCPTPTPLPVPTATSAPTATSTSTMPTATATSAAPAPTTTSTPAPTASASTTSGTTTASVGSFVGLVVPSSCVTCPYYAGNNPSQAQIATALANAAAKYHIPVNLLKAVAWQESHWHEDVTSCDGGIGLMQVQYYVYPWLNQQDISDCHSLYNIYATNYDPYNLQDNAYLGAKMLAYLTCFWSYWGGYDYDANGNPHSLTNPTKYTVAWYYQQVGLPYPDSSQPNSLCAAVFNQNDYFPALPSSTSDVWSCPFSATAGDTTLLDITVSSYNEGAGNVIKYGINNMWYVNGVETFIPQFASGALPVPS